MPQFFLGGGDRGAPAGLVKFLYGPAVWYKWGAPRIVFDRQTDSRPHTRCRPLLEVLRFLFPPLPNILFYLPLAKGRGEGRVTIMQV